MDHGEPNKKRKYGELAAHDDKALLDAMSSYVEMRQRVYRAEVASSTLVAKNHQLEKQAIEQARTIRDQQQKIEIGAEAYKKIIQEQKDNLQKVTEENLEPVIQIYSLTAKNQSYTLWLKERENEMENKDMVIAQKQKEIGQLVSLPKKLEELEKTLSDKDFQLKEALAQVEAIKSQQQKIEIGAELYKKIIQEQKDNLQKVTDENLKLVEKGKNLVIQINSLTATNQSYTLQLKEKEKEIENKDLVIAQKRKEIMEQLLPLWKNLHKIEKKNSDKDFQLKEALAQVEAIKSQQQNIAEPYEKIIQEQKLQKVTNENLKLVEKCKDLVIQLNSLADTNQSYVLQWKEKEKEMEKKDRVIAYKRKEIMKQLLPLWKNLHKIEKKNCDKDFQLKEALAQVEAIKSQLQESNDRRQAAILERDAARIERRSTLAAVPQLLKKVIASHEFMNPLVHSRSCYARYRCHVTSEKIMKVLPSADPHIFENLDQDVLNNLKEANEALKNLKLPILSDIVADLDKPIADILLSLSA